MLGRIADLNPDSDAAVNAEIARKMGIRIYECPGCEGALDILSNQSYSIYLDAVFGTGLNTLLRGAYPALFKSINDLNKSWIAVDVPSGLNSDTGMPMGAAVKAKTTVTFAFAKRGFQQGEGPEYCGEIKVVGIGLPREMEENPEAFLDE